MEMIRKAQQGGGGFEDAEYGLNLAELQNRAGRNEADYVAGTTGVNAKYGALTRDMEQAHPNDLRAANDSAAGRGMLYSGGRLEEDSKIRQNHAAGLARAGANQTDELNGMLRQATNNREDIGTGVSSAMQNASQRALERARQQQETQRAERAMQPIQQVNPEEENMRFRQQVEPQIQPIAEAIVAAPKQAAGVHNPKNATVTVKGQRVTTNSQGIINTKGPYYGMYPSQVG